MKKLITLLLFIVNFGIIIAQNQDFDDKSSYSNSYTPPVLQYQLSGIWTILTNSPNSVSRSCCAYVEISGVPYLYQFGGGNSNTELKRVARLNLQTNTWQNNYSTMPYPISSGTAIPMNGGTEIYVFGGNYPSSLGKTLKYNVSSNSWQTLNNMSTKITDALVVKYNESKIIVIGGGDGYFGNSSLKTNKVQVFNIAGNSYSYSNNLPLPISMLGGGIYRDTIITIGGYTGGNAIANCYKGVINPNDMSITWSQISDYPAGSVTRPASYVAVKNTGVGIMCTGGAIGGTDPTDQTHFWNFCTQSWQGGLPDNTQARSNYKACGKGYDVIYTVGGYQTNNSSNRTEKITFQTIEGPCMNMVGLENGNNTIPSNYELKQNYPNPFNPETKISFSLPQGGYVKLTVSDITGKILDEPLSKILTAGNHTISYNASMLPSGIYFYTLSASGFTETKKMLLIK